jgi:hypothetical protein
MRKNRLLFVILMMMALALLPAIPVGAKGTRTEFSGIENMVDILDWGEWTTLPSGRQQIRGWVLENYDDTNDPRATGTNIVTINANWDADGAGPFWGTFHLVPDGYDGYWEGSFTAKMPAEGCAPIKAVGHGRGELEGLKYTLWAEGCGLYSNLTGEILDSHGG